MLKRLLLLVVYCRTAQYPPRFYIHFLSKLQVLQIKLGRDHLLFCLSRAVGDGIDHCDYKMSAITRLDVGIRMSEAAIYNNTVYLAGQIAPDASEDISGQTTQVLAEIDKLLQRAGTDKTRLLMAQIFLADINEFPQMNAVWDSWVAPGHTPPRATVQASLANPLWKVEIVVTAALL